MLFQPDLNAYNEAKEAVGEAAFYADANTYVHGMHKDTPEALDRLSKDIKDQARWTLNLNLAGFLRKCTLG